VRNPLKTALTCAYGLIMRSDEELAGAVAGRPHWRLEGAAAVYAPPGSVSTVRVVAVAGGGHRERYRAIVISEGRARHSRPAGTAVEAVGWAERIQLG
jgi:hypothetical protein